MTEYVNGTVIGPITTKKPYAFYDLHGQEIVGVEWFEDDETAVAWFRARYPTAYRVGVEMRCWDKEKGT